MERTTPPGPPSIEYVERILLKKGFTTTYAAEWRRKYNSLRGNAVERGRICWLTFSQYMALAKRACLTDPDQIGKAKGKYQMSRLGDHGDYIKGNCRFLTMEENIAEKAENGGAKRGAAKTAVINSKPFIAVSPTGKKYRSRNLVSFSKTHDLHRQSMCRVFLGQRPHHKGWTGKYITTEVYREAL